MVAQGIVFPSFPVIGKYGIGFVDGFHFFGCRRIGLVPIRMKGKG